MTSPYHIRIAPTARRHILELPQKTQRIIIKLVESLAINPRPPGVKKIEGMTGLYADQIEQVKLVYKIEEHEVLLLLVKQLHGQQ
jgi:mRNA interferase RelE/StbE